MQLDAYQRCVGGSDKKIKFCCGKDIVTDLNDVFAALEADQRAAALDRINRAIAKNGDKDCLLATKVSVLIQLREYEQAEPLVATLLSRNPRNPVALGQRTTLLAIADKVDDAVACLQDSLEHYDRTISRGVLNAIRIVGALLRAHDRVVAARAHLVLYNLLSTEPDPEVARLMLSTFNDPRLSPLLKHDFDLPTAPAGGSWSDTYNAIRVQTQRGRWSSSLARLRELDEQYPGQPILRKAVAILEGRIGTNESHAAAWRRYAETQGVPLEEAIEAEAIAQTLLIDMLDDTECERRLSVHEIKDAEAVIERLEAFPLAARHADASLPIDDMPPPKAVFSMLDRPPIPEDQPLRLDAIPTVMGTVMVYGRETDRSPRIEVEGYAGFGLEQVHHTLIDVLGDQLTAQPTEAEVIGLKSIVDLTMGIRWFLARPIDAETRRSLLREHLERFHRQVWPEMKLSRFGGQTPRQAAKDPAHHRVLAAWLLATEESTDTAAFDWLDLNPIRAELGLPLRNRISPDAVSLERLPLFRFSQLDFDALSGEKLDRVLHIGKISGHAYVLRRAIERKLATTSELPAKEAYELHAIHAFLTPDVAAGAADLDRLDALANDAQVSKAVPLLTRLDWALAHGQAAMVEATLKTLERRHMSDPNVGREVARLLVRYGVIDPESLGAGDEPVAAPAPKAAATIWTPDAPAAPAGGSKLWMPGME